MARRAKWMTALMRCAVIMSMLVSSFPIFWLVSTSFKPDDQWTSFPPVWITERPTLQNYRIVFFPEAARAFASKQSHALDYKVAGSAWKAFVNSSIVSTLATLFSVTLGTLAAYGMTRFRTGGEGFAFQVLSVRMFPPIAVVVPVVVMFSMLHLTDSYTGLILAYTAFTLPFSTWMVRSFLYEIPEELEGAAMIHGMSQLRAFVHIVLPLIRGGVLATALFVFILNWSEFLFALTLTSGSVTTVTVQVAKYVSASSGTLYGVQAAMGTISTLPVIAFGYLIQRHIVRGLTFGSIKR